MNSRYGLMSLSSGPKTICAWLGRSFLRWSGFCRCTEESKSWCPDSVLDTQSFSLQGSNIDQGLSGLDCDLFCAEAPGNDYIPGEGVHHSDLEFFGLG